MNYYLFNCMKDEGSPISYTLESEINDPIEAFKEVYDKLKLQPCNHTISLKIMGFQTISNSEFSLLNKNNFAIDIKSELKYSEDDIVSVDVYLIRLVCSESEIITVADHIKDIEIRPVADPINYIHEGTYTIHDSTKQTYAFTIVGTLRSYNRFIDYFNGRILFEIDNNKK